MNDTLDINGLSESEIERLAMLAEEAGEVIQIVGKILRHGYESRWPVDTGTSNRERLNHELTDLFAVAKRMIESYDIPEVSEIAIDAAWSRKLRYSNYQ